jgi:hypothetical protein
MRCALSGRSAAVAMDPASVAESAGVVRATDVATTRPALAAAQYALHRWNRHMFGSLSEPAGRQSYRRTVREAGTRAAPVTLVECPRLLPASARVRLRPPWATAGQSCPAA